MAVDAPRIFHNHLSEHHLSTDQCEKFPTISSKSNALERPAPAFKPPGPTVNPLTKLVQVPELNVARFSFLLSLVWELWQAPLFR
jgi:hypothetical protein